MAWSSKIESISSSASRKVAGINLNSRGNSSKEATKPYFAIY